MRGGRGDLDERKERIDESTGVLDARKLGKPETLRYTLKRRDNHQQGKRSTSMHCRNGRKDEGASACGSVSDNGDRFNIALAASEIRLKLHRKVRL